MNIVFWLIVVIVLVLIWFCLSFAFKGVGGVGMRLYNELIEKIKYEQWNGELPTVTGSTPIISLEP